MTKPMRFYYRSSRFDTAGQFVPGVPVGVPDEALAIDSARTPAPADRPGTPDLADPRLGGVEAVIERRLSQICDTLGLAPDFFAVRDAQALAKAEAQTSEHARLAEAFDGLSDPLLRQRVLDLLAHLGSRR